MFIVSLQECNPWMCMTFLPLHAPKYPKSLEEWLIKYLLTM